MKWWYHWNLKDIKGYFDQVEGKRWLICVNNCPVSPELIAGRKITVRAGGETGLRRLGQYLHNIGTVSYFSPWPDKASEDYTPSGRAGRLLARFRQTPDPRLEVTLRQELRSAGAVARARLGVIPWPIKVFERYALEPLESVILELAAKGLYAQPINDLHESKIDGLRLLSDLAAALASKDKGGQGRRSTQNF